MQPSSPPIPLNWNRHWYSQHCLSCPCRAHHRILMTIDLFTFLTMPFRDRGHDGLQEFRHGRQCGSCLHVHTKTSVRRRVPCTNGTVSLSAENSQNQYLGPVLARGFSGPVLYSPRSLVQQPALQLFCPLSLFFCFTLSPSLPQLLFLRFSQRCSTKQMNPKHTRCHQSQVVVTWQTNLVSKNGRGFLSGG